MCQLEFKNAKNYLLVQKCTAQEEWLFNSSRRLDLLSIDISLKNYAGVVDPVVLKLGDKSYFAGKGGYAYCREPFPHNYSNKLPSKFEIW